MSFGNDRVLKAKLFEGVSSKRNYADVLTGFENGITKLIGYSDGTTRPTGVFGGSATNLTKASNSVNPIENSFSLKLARTAAAQGQGYYFDFVPSRKDKLSGANLNIKFAIELLTGTFSGSINPSVDSDLIIGVWDMANNKNIEPSTRLLEPMVMNYIYNYNSSFQIPINATTLRVYIHSATTNSATFEVNLDDIEISRSNSNGVIMRPPVGTIISFGSVTPPVGFLYCDGSAVSRTTYAKLFQAIGIGYGSGDGSTTFNLPNAKGVFLRGAGTQNIGGENRTGNIGTTENDQFQGHRHSISDPGHTHNLKTVASGDNNNMWHRAFDNFPPSTGDGGWNTTNYGSSGAGIQSSGTGISVTDPTTGINGAARVGPETRPANITVAYHICYDDGNTSIADTYSGTNIIACYSLNADVAANNAILKYDKVLTDRTGSYNPATGQFTCKISGTAKVITKNFSTSNVTELQIRKNTVNQARGGDGTTANDQSSTVVAAFDVEAGNIIDIFNNTTATFYAGANDNILIIEIEPLNKIIAPMQKQKAKYSTLSGQAVSTSTKINFGTLSYDTYGIVSNAGSNFLINPKKSGFLKISVVINIQAAVNGLGTSFNVEIWKNGIAAGYMGFDLVETTNNFARFIEASDEFETLATDNWYVAISTNNGTRNLRTDIDSTILIEVE